MVKLYNKIDGMPSSDSVENEPPVIIPEPPAIEEKPVVEVLKPKRKRKVAIKEPEIIDVPEDAEPPLWFKKYIRDKVETRLLTVKKERKPRKKLQKLNEVEEPPKPATLAPPKSPPQPPKPLIENKVEPPPNQHTNKPRPPNIVDRENAFNHIVKGRRPRFLF